jgi:hypothetical protein
MSKSEHRIQDEIRLALSEHGIVLRLNSGQAYGGTRVWDKRYGYILKDIRPIALCGKGTPDLLFIGTNGNVAFVEVKDNQGRIREDQKRFLAMVQQYGYKAGIARSVEEALKIIGEENDTL